MKTFAYYTTLVVLFIVCLACALAVDVLINLLFNLKSNYGRSVILYVAFWGVFGLLKQLIKKKFFSARDSDKEDIDENQTID